MEDQAVEDLNRRRARWWMLIAVAGAVSLIGAVSAHHYAQLHHELTESALARRASFATSTAATISEKLDRVVDVGVSLASRVQFGQLAAAGNWQQAAEILRRVPGDFAYVSRASLFDIDGVYRAGVPDRLPFVGQSSAHREWYRGVMGTWVPFVSPAYLREASPPLTVFATALPIRGADTRPVAILHLETEIEPFFRWLAAIDSGLGESFSVIDSQGQLVWRTGAGAAGRLPDAAWLPGASEALRGAAGARVTPGEGDGEAVYSYAPVRHGWGLVVAQPAAQVFLGRNALLRTVVVDGVLIVLVVGVAVLLGGKVLAKLREQAVERRHRAGLEQAHETLRRQAERLRIVHDIDSAIITAVKPEAIAAAVIEPLRQLLEVPRAIVNLFDLEAGEVEWLAAAGRHRVRAGPGVRYAIGLMGELAALRRGEAQRIDVRGLPPGPAVDALLASGVEHYAVVPMIAGGELIGAVSFGGERPEYSADQMAIAGEVAAQLAIAIAQTRLFEKVSRHAAELERRVAERTAELDDLYNRAPCGYHSVDGDGVIVRINDTWLAWLGYTRGEVVGRMRHADLMTPQSAAYLRDEAFPLFRGQGWLKDVEFEYRRKDGSTFPGSLNATSVLDGEGRFVMSRSAVVDITDRKRIERELQAAYRELEGFSYSVSHDLRAPLRAIDGFALMLEEDYAARLDDEGRRLLSVVRGNARRMGALIDDLLAFSRVSRTEPQRLPVDMGGLAREVAAEVAAGIDSPVEIEALPAAQGDRALLKQVWINLLANACKFSAKRERPQVRVGGKANGTELVYWVRDNGAGFDPRYAGKLFGVFQRLHRDDEFPGTGVGLAIVQRVVSRHGGRVWAEGELGKGACFYFTLPKEA